MGKQGLWFQLAIVALPLILLFSCDDGEKDWNKAKLLNTKKGYQEFIENNSSSHFTVDAEFKIDSIEFIEILKTDNFDSIKSYISDHLPDTLIEKATDTIIIPIKIGNQIWMANNLNVDHFRNGDIITEVKADYYWKIYGDAGKAAWCNDISDNKYRKRYWYYGKLYNWFAVHDKRGLAPKGWHIATIKEYMELIKFLGENSDEKMKSTSDWKNSQNGTNSSGFSGFPGGGREGYTGRFFNNSYFGIWWSSDFQVNKEVWENGLKDRIYAHYYYLTYDRKFQPDVSWGPENGFSVRCIKD